jgi:HAMP domain-containing protein
MPSDIPLTHRIPGEAERCNAYQHSASGDTQVTNHISSLLRYIGVNERRKARNFLLNPGLQLKLPLHIVLLSCAFAGAALLFGYLYFEQLYLLMIESSPQGEFLQASVKQQTSNFIELSITLLISYIVLVIGISLLYTHRIIGPTIAIRRHIRAMKEGLYSHRVCLRKHDELKELARELNELAGILEQRNSN